jgi:hypothetical protein
MLSDQWSVRLNHIQGGVGHDSLSGYLDRDATENVYVVSQLPQPMAQDMKVNDTG